MPVADSDYHPPRFLQNPHLQTIFQAIARKIKLRYERERIELSDGDFIDLDWMKTGSKKLAVVCHGFEGNADASYVKGMVRAMNRRGWDAVALNYRGCSGEPNNFLRSYHAGSTEDLQEVIDFILKKDQYQQLSLIGFSQGGNLVLKYAGEQGDKLPEKISAVAAVSVPCDLKCVAINLSRPSNFIYLRKFLLSLKQKIRLKKSLLPADISFKELMAVKSIGEYDELFQAPVHGFENAEDYWRKTSSLYFVSSITRPTLLINAKDDPFLTPECFPVKEAEANPKFTMETPEKGGHVAFIQFGNGGEYYHERRIGEFLEKHLQ